MHRGKQSHAGQTDRRDKLHLTVKDVSLCLNGLKTTRKYKTACRSKWRNIIIPTEIHVCSIFSTSTDFRIANVPFVESVPG